jgi:hypothetical protein
MRKGVAREGFGVFGRLDSEKHTKKSVVGRKSHREGP